MVQVIFNRKHVAQLLACSPSTVDLLVRRGLLEYTRRWPGGPKCFLWEHVERYKARIAARTNDRLPGEDHKKR